MKSDRFNKFEGNGLPCLSPKGEGAFGLARPWVIKKENIYMLWYSERSSIQPYKIKFATSLDGIDWIDHDGMTVQTSPSGWDSEMVAFSAIIETQYGVYMFYNGNGYGASGFGYAQLNGNLDQVAAMCYDK